MTVAIEKSICVDCVWRGTCQKLERINTTDKRENPGHTKDVFEIIVLRCSMRNYDRSYKNNDGIRSYYLYYCLECDMYHRSNSRVGILHKKESS